MPAAQRMLLIIIVVMTGYQASEGVYQKAGHTQTAVAKGVQRRFQMSEQRAAAKFSTSHHHHQQLEQQRRSYNPFCFHCHLKFTTKTTLTPLRMLNSPSRIDSTIIPQALPSQQRPVGENLGCKTAHKFCGLS